MSRHDTRHALLLTLLGGPLTSQDMIARSGRKRPGTSRNWGNSYFLPERGGNSWRCSLIWNGWMSHTGMAGRRRIFTITAKGLAEIAHLIPSG